MPLIFVAVVGGANMDIVARTHGEAITGDSTPGQIHCSPGGVARNLAENLARLGRHACLISAVGEDQFGQSLRMATQAAGVDISGVQVLPTMRTATYLSVHGADGDMSLAVNDMAILEFFTPEFLQSQSATIGAASALVLDCNLPAPTLAWLMTQAANVPVFVDGVSAQKCQRLRGLLEGIHTLKVNQLEAQALSGLPTQSLKGAQAAALALHQQGVRRVVVSMGAHGVCWCDDAGVVGACAARPMSVVNSSGAGDALLAGLVHAHLAEQPMLEAVTFAMACAELTLGTTFANHPDLSVSAVQGWQASKSCQSESTSS
ncbi:PfkB family carbohydrate kinase [Rhodoferax sp. PAMC 29310]|uniref:PfkB family carbohydrate kinase n=1 Tax=Rhodoferax sp. PAMC 29310 TaxID=2822760 RepID=UPI001B335EAA|nr:PfkB family carbohydrate kinase [Rhodoferax sp. PAMC 29310]